MLIGSRNSIEADERTARVSRTAGGPEPWIVPLLLTGLLLIVAHNATADQSRSPMPEFTGARLYIGPDVTDRASYERLQGEIERLEAASSQSYYVVVVRSSGRGPYATRDYIDELFADWSDPARHKGRNFDPERSILVVMALENRQVSVHPGDVLQNEYGLTATTIDRRIAQPEFVPLARQGDYPAALSRLLHAVDDWIGSRDQAEASRRHAAEQRAAQLRDEAEAARNEANRLLDEAQHELQAKKAEGLNVEDVASQVAQTQRVVTSLPSRITDDPAGALSDAQQAQQTLQQAIDTLRQRIAQRAEATTTLDALTGQVRDVDGAILGALQSGLAVGSAREDLDDAQDRIDSARSILTTDPTRSLAQAKDAEGRLEAIRREIAELPALRKRREYLAGRVRPLADQTTTALDHAAGTGADVAAIRSEIEPTLRKVADAVGPSVNDERRAVATLQAAESELRGVLERVEAVEARHRFLSRTLPILLGVAIVGLVLLVLGLLRWFHLRSYWKVEGRFKEFRGRSVEVMDRLDALKERYKLLPVTDKDFTEPMTGATLALYGKIQKELDGLWDRWLKIMETIDEAQRLIRNRSTLGTRKLDAAGQILDQGDLFDEVRTQEQAVAADLDRLNNAHEEADVQLEALDAKLTEVNARLKALAEASLGPDAFAETRSAIAAQAQQGNTIRTPDPLSAQEALQQARERTEALLQRLDAVLARSEEASQVVNSLDAIAGLAAKQRADGVPLVEDGGNPDPALAQGRQAHAQAMDSLRAGDPDAAGEAIQAAAAQASQARQVIDRSVEARDFCRRALPARRDATRRLDEALAQGEADHDELSRDFAPLSWQALCRPPRTGARFATGSTRNSPAPATPTRPADSWKRPDSWKRSPDSSRRPSA